MKKKIDHVFATKKDKIEAFEFNETVVKVFDDMVSRSVPFYDEIHRIIIDLLRYNDGKKLKIYDLGCSTGTTIILIDQYLQSVGKRAHFIGIDNSDPMINKCEQKLAKKKVRSYELLCTKIEDIDFCDADLVIMNYTLQFIPINNRKRIVTNIHDGLKKNGMFVLSEKISCENEGIHQLQTDLYYDFKKRNGYSELEIAQKREALENVLIPITPEKQLKLLKSAGFTKKDMLFRWYNFACFLGIK